MAEELLSVAGEDVEPNMVARTMMTASYFWTGRYPKAWEQVETALALYDAEMHAEQFLAYSFDMKLATLVYGSQLTWMLGYPDSALALKREMDESCEHLNNPYMTAFVNGWGATVLEYAGPREAHLRQVETSREISRAHGLLFFEAQTSVWIGWNRVLSGDLEDGIGLMSDGLDRMRAAGAGALDGVGNAYLAMALLSAGRPDDAERHIESGLERVAIDGLHPHEAELHRAKGMLLEMRGAPEAAR